MESQKKQMMKRQFRIGDLAKELKVKKFVIRFWEKEFDLKSDRSEGGQRFYTDEDLDVFFAIKDLLYNQGFTIAGAKKQLPEALSGGARRIGSEELMEGNFASVIASEETIPCKDLDNELVMNSNHHQLDDRCEQDIEFAAVNLDHEALLNQDTSKGKDESHEKALLCLPARMALDPSFYENLETFKKQLTRLYELLD